MMPSVQMVQQPVQMVQQPVQMVHMVRPVMMPAQPVKEKPQPKVLSFFEQLMLRPLESAITWLLAARMHARMFAYST
jgi:hypothetical protein